MNNLETRLEKKKEEIEICIRGLYLKFREEAMKFKDAYEDGSPDSEKPDKMLESAETEENKNKNLFSDKIDQMKSGID